MYASLADVFRLIKCISFYKLLNYLLTHFKLLLIRAGFVNIKPGRPSFITAEPSALCNLMCPGCVTGSGTMKRQVGIMGFETFSRLIQETRKDVIYLNLYFQGEPFLNPDVFRCIALASHNKIYTAVSTNGHFLSTENCEKLIDARLQRIIISLDGTSEETYSKYRVNGSFHKVTEGIRALAAAKKKAALTYPFIEVQMLASAYTMHQIEGFNAFVKSLGANKAVVKSMQLLPHQQAQTWLPQNNYYSRYYIDDKGNPVLKKKKTFCRRIFTTLVVDWNGDVVACCYDKDSNYLMGNIHSSTVNEIWRGEAFVRFRKNFLKNDNKPDICTNCF